MILENIRKYAQGINMHKSITYNQKLTLWIRMNWMVIQAQLEEAHWTRDLCWMCMDLFMPCKASWMRFNDRYIMCMKKSILWQPRSYNVMTFSRIPFKIRVVEEYSIMINITWKNKKKRSCFQKFCFSTIELAYITPKCLGKKCPYSWSVIEN